MIRKKEFVTFAFDLENEAFIVYVVSIIPNSDVHPSKRAQIILLKADEAPTSVIPK